MSVGLNQVGITGILVEALRIDVSSSVDHCWIVIVVLRHIIGLMLRGAGTKY